MVSFNITDGDGGSVINTYSLTQSLARRFAFQEGVDGGQGLYSGVADVQLAENQPNTNLPIGANPETEGLLVDFDGGTANSQVLLRFDNIFGSGPGQIPLGSKIAAARLVLDTNNPGDGGTFHRLLTSFDANTDTWNSFANGVAPRNTTAGVQADGFEALAGFESQVGVAAGNSDPDAGVTIIGVTADLQAWANGEANNGWMIKGWEEERTVGHSRHPRVRTRLIVLDWKLIGSQQRFHRRASEMARMVMVVHKTLRSSKVRQMLAVQQRPTCLWMQMIQDLRTTRRFFYDLIQSSVVLPVKFLLAR